MVPHYQALMRPVLECAASGETKLGDVVEILANRLGLSADERMAMLPSGKLTRFANRVNWAKSYLKQGGLVEITGRGKFGITDRGRAALADVSVSINNAYLAQFEEFQSFKRRAAEAEDTFPANPEAPGTESTPDEDLRRAHSAITTALSSDLLDRVRKATPAFFERLLVELLVAMGYGGTSADAGRAIGKSDGVIDQDPLGVDQLFCTGQAIWRGQ